MLFAGCLVWICKFLCKCLFLLEKTNKQRTLTFTVTVLTCEFCFYGVSRFLILCKPECMALSGFKWKRHLMYVLISRASFFSAINEGFSCITYFFPEINLKCPFVLISYLVAQPLLHSSFSFHIFMFLFYISHLDSPFANFSVVGC